MYVFEGFLEGGKAPSPQCSTPLPTYLQQFLHREDGLADGLNGRVCSLTTGGQHICGVHQEQEFITIMAVCQQLQSTETIVELNA